MTKLFTPSKIGLALAAFMTLACQGDTFNPHSTSELINNINSLNSSLNASHIINLDAITYNLSGELPFIKAGKTVTMNGGTANPMNTVIHQQTAGARILETFFDGSANNVVLTVNNITFDNGQAGEFGGGALLVGGVGSVTTVNNCIFSNNKATTTGGGGAISSSPNGNLTVVGCRFTGNTSKSFSGAIDFLNQSGGSGSFLVQNSVFLNNTADADGGAIRTSAFGGTSTILNCNFEGNHTTTTTGRGGMIMHAEGSIVMHYNRFYNNTAGTHANGDTFFQGSGGTIGSSDLTFNWWGANTGPTATDLNLLTPVVNPVTFSPWLQLRNVPDATALSSGGSTTLRADLLGQNVGGPLAAVNLLTTPLLPDAPATIFNNLTPALGSLSASSSRFSQGKATSTFTAGSAKGTASIQATLDSQTITANIVMPVTAISINRLTATPSNLGTVQWTVTFDGAVSGVVAGNFTLVKTGLGGTPVITTVTASGGAPNATWTVSASTGSGSGTLGLNLTSSSGITPVTGNIPLTGQIYTMDLVAPTTSLTGTPAANSASATATFTFMGNDVGSGLAGFESSLDGGAFSAATSPQLLSGLTDGSHTFQVRAKDNAGNLDATPESFTWTIDATPPTVGIGSPSVPVTKGGPVTYTVTYSDAHFNSSTLANGNVTLNKTGTANGTLIVSGSGTSRTVTISSITGDGTLGISLAAGTATDTAGNSAPSAGPSATFIVDNTAPTVVISAPSAASTAAGPVTYTVTYADASFNSSTLTPGDISLNPTETASGTVGVSGIGNTRLVTISGITGKGTLGISITANTATDLGGNHAPAAGPSATFIVNHPPVAGTATIQRYPTESVKVKVAALLGFVTDADSDVITLTGVQSPSPGGGTVVIKGDNVIYTPTPNFTLADTFTYSVSDTRGGTATGTVQVNIVTDNSQSQNILGIENLGGGVFRISFNGIPNRIYTIQFTTNLSDPWQTLGTAHADALGVVVYTDSSGSASRLYRTVYP